MSEKKDKVSVLKGTGIGPTVSLEEGLKRLDDYMRENPVREMLGISPEMLGISPMMRNVGAADCASYI